MPEVVGVRLTGQLQPGATATDLVLYITEMLRKYGVVGRFVEFFGAGLSTLGLADRATISNMAPEYGATASIFPVDDETLTYLRMTGRSRDTIELVETYMKAQGLFRTDETPEPTFNAVLELDLGTVMPSLAGPRRPQDRVLLGDVQRTFRSSYAPQFEGAAPAAPKTAVATLERSAPKVGEVEILIGNSQAKLHHGSVAIAAITSCTNTSNPSVMIGAGLLAKNAVERGLDTSPAVKTSLAPGSQVVTRYLEQAGLTPYLEALGFHTVGYGCTTCIGNSGPLPDAVAEAVDANQLVVSSVISGNRNFEGRVHPQVRASFLASPPLVVAYALAGTVDINLETDPLGYDPNGDPVFLADIWPTPDDVKNAIAESVTPEMYVEEYGEVFLGDERWQSLPIPTGALFEFEPGSTYVREPSFFTDLSPEPGPINDIVDARVLALLGDSITTDHISPAGSISKTSPAAQYLNNMDVKQVDFNSYGSRRGNHEVMVRGTFANIRLRNALVPGSEGNITLHFPSGEQLSIFEASMRYQQAGTPLIVLAGKEYGTGSSRDWAAKGTLLLGIKAVIAESFERIHRSNLVGMGVLPLQFLPGESAATLGLTGEESFSFTNLQQVSPKQVITVTATRPDGSTLEFQALVRIDSSIEVEYYRHGGILQMVLRRLMQA
jgi:aconitate hydratase